MAALSDRMETMASTTAGGLKPAQRAKAGSGVAPRPDVSVVLPCLDEADSVAGCVAEAAEALAGAGLSGEVVVVDNGSTDGSAAIAGRTGARVIRQPKPGYGRALRAGFSA